MIAKGQRYIRDTSRLISKLARTSKRTVPSLAHINDICMTEANGADKNMAARSFLIAQRGMNDLRYYGIKGYYEKFQKERLLRSTSTSSAETEPKAASLPTSSNTVAKVPFIITTQQRSELQAMGFSIDEIKKLTPLKACIILEHKLKPEDCFIEPILDELVQERERAQVEAAQEMRAEQERLLGEQEQSREFETSNTEQEPQTTYELDAGADADAALPSATDAFLQPTNSEWFGIFQNSERIALYRTKAEAAAFIQYKTKGLKGEDQREFQMKIVEVE